MDPWLESPRVFPDFRFSFIVKLSGHINQLLPEGFYSRLAFRKWFEPSGHTLTEPDVLVPRNELPDAVLVPLGGTLWEERQESFVEICSLEYDPHRVCTHLDLASRENKTTEHPTRTLYSQQQRQDIWDGVNRVDFDLLREGQPTTLASVALLPKSLDVAPYSATLYRDADPNRLTVHQFGLFDLLPKIAVPLGKGYSDIHVDLASLISECYEGARYDRWGIYARPCDPPLTPEQQAWAEGILREKGLLK